MAVPTTLLKDIVNSTSHCISYLQDDNLKTTLSRFGITMRKLFAPFLRRIYLTQSDYKLIIDNREKLPKHKNGYIFLINHRQADDIVIGVNAVAKNGYIVFGNADLALETQNGIGLFAYGMILTNRSSPTNRKSTYEKMKYVLEHSGNIIIYPEGYWNLDDDGESDEKHRADAHNSINWLIQDFNIGAFRLAQETGAFIVPVVLHYDEIGKKRCYAVRGKRIAVDKTRDVFTYKEETLDIMRTVYFNLMQKYSTYKRAAVETEGKSLSLQWNHLKNDLVNACDIRQIGYHLDLKNEKLIGKAKVIKVIVTKKEAFEHLNHLIPCRENAFLLRQR